MNDEPKRRGFNGWKWAFFIALVAFEFTRETLVLSSIRELPQGSSFYFASDDNFVEAAGQWARTDGGSDMAPGTVTIDCNRTSNVCLEASLTYVSATVATSIVIDRFVPTEFTSESVSYGTYDSSCATYTVRMDLIQKRVTATRTKKPGATGICANLEDQVAMELRDGYSLRKRVTLDDHIVPIWKLINWVGRLLS